MLAQIISNERVLVKYFNLFAAAALHTYVNDERDTYA